MIKKIWLPQLAACIMLLIALEPSNDYGYYVLLRWVCCGVFAYIAFEASSNGQKEWTWILGITAAVYNPFFRVHLNRDFWEVVNVITIGIAIVSIFTIKSNLPPMDTKNKEATK